ncbi:MAG: LacI family DNA-binding transcriptional regulator [Lachnospiraceae bacterium]|nr:LacI family DNA-binding transcriptional regulator [Lachnospiraceae bacterium]
MKKIFNSSLNCVIIFIMNIRKIAKLCKVSPSTVSRVLNHPELVSTDTRDKILSKLGEKEFTVRKYSKKQDINNNLVYFIYDANYEQLYSDMYRGFESILRSKNIYVSLCPIANDDIRRSYVIDMLCTTKCAGVIWALEELHLEEINKFIKNNVPVILSRKYKDSPSELSNCYIDLSIVATKMTDFLIKQDLNKVYLLLNTDNTYQESDIVEGFKMSFFANKRKYNDKLVVKIKKTYENIVGELKKIISQDQKVDAFFCLDNDIAFMVINALHEMKISVPKNISVVSFIDTKLSELCNPKITSMDLSIKQLGIITAETLLKQIESRNTKYVKNVVVQPKICIRESCKIKNRSE